MYLSILFSLMIIIHFEMIRCIFVVSDEVWRTQPLTYRPGSVPVKVSQPTMEAVLATMVNPCLETDGDKPGPILDFPRLKALAVFCPIVAAPTLPADWLCLRWRNTSLVLRFDK